MLRALRRFRWDVARRAARLLVAGALAALLTQPGLGADPLPSAPEAIDSARALLRLGGIDESHWARLTDGVPWRPDEDETLLLVLMRLRDFKATDLERWAQGRLVPPPWTAEPAKRRGELYRLRGRAVSVEVIQPPPEVAQRLEIDRYYRVTMDLAGLVGWDRVPPPSPRNSSAGNRTQKERETDDPRRPLRATVFAATVPKAWRRGGRVDEPAGAIGLFLKLEGDATEAPRPVLVAERIAWYPNNTLGRLGMDAGLLETLRDRTRIDGRERECFYQMLAAVGRAGAGQLAEEARRQWDSAGRTHDEVAPLFNDPADQRGRLVLLSGTLRRAVRVRVDDPDIVPRLGIDHYYELYLFTDDSQGNPVVFCVRDVPKDMPIGEGPEYAERVEAAGFFLKSWAYRSGQQQGQPAAARQLAPLLIGRDVRWFPAPEPATRDVWGLAGGVLFLVVLAAMWFLLWRWGRGDRRFRAATLGRLRKPPTPSE